MSNPIGFTITNSTVGWNNTDFDDVFARKDCFLEGGLWSWGRNNAGQMGDNTLINRSSPVQTVSGGTNWREISSRGTSAGGIKTDGTLWMWGSSYSGQLGKNDRLGTSSPVQTVSQTCDWRTLSVGGSNAGAIKTDGSLWIWGSGSFGNNGDNTVISRSSPVQTISGGTNWKKISLGGSSGAIKTDGTLWMWGRNVYGGLATNNATNRSSPVQTVSGGTNWKTIDVGSYHTAAIKTDGTLWLWGRGYQGVMGNESVLNTSSPVQTVSGGTNWKQVSAGDCNTAAIKTDGTLWVWGRGYSGQIGNNSILSRSSPVQTVSGGTNWKTASIAVSNVLAIKTDGTLWVWGGNDNGMLGINQTPGTASNRSSPVQTISGGTSWRCALSAGLGAAGFSIAIREDCW